MNSLIFPPQNLPIWCIRIQILFPPQWRKCLFLQKGIFLQFCSVSHYPLGYQRLSSSNCSNFLLAVTSHCPCNHFHRHTNTLSYFPTSKTYFFTKSFILFEFLLHFSILLYNRIPEYPNNLLLPPHLAAAVWPSPMRFCPSSTWNLLWEGRQQPSGWQIWWTSSSLILLCFSAIFVRVDTLPVWSMRISWLPGLFS